MIELHDVRKAYRVRDGVKTILDGITLTLPRGRSIGLLGLNGAGKSTLLRLIAGTEEPDAGHIRRRVRISWPLGASGALHGNLTGSENIQFVCRIYGIDYRRTRDFVADFSELGNYMLMPLRTYSSGMRARLAFALSMAVDFDCYLIDEITAVGDFKFQERCRNAFAERRRRCDVIMVSHNPKTLKEYCQAALLLRGGTLQYFEDLDHVARIYMEKSA
jgi:capsular polysaccharide transport system ATP-binding protein